jgi:uncharacterized protein YggT (Ycf19 family)
VEILRLLKPSFVSMDFSIEIIIACFAFLSTHGLHVTTPLPPSPKSLVLGGY